MEPASMRRIKQNDEVRMTDPDTGKEWIGIVNIVKDAMGDAHVRVHDYGMVVIPTAELSLVTDEEVDD